MAESFGEVIRAARKEAGVSQRGLAKSLRVDFTYLSKLENDRADYPAKEDVIRSLAQHLDLDEDELVFLAGRIPQKYDRFLKDNARDLSRLFQQLQEDPDFAARVFQTTR